MIEAVLCSWLLATLILMLWLDWSDTRAQWH